MRQHVAAATKHATKWYAAEKEKPKGLSAKSVSEKVKVQYGGYGPSTTSIIRMVKNGQVGIFTIKRGTKSDLPDFIF